MDIALLLDWWCRISYGIITWHDSICTAHELDYTVHRSDKFVDDVSSQNIVSYIDYYIEYRQTHAL